MRHLHLADRRWAAKPELQARCAAEGIDNIVFKDPMPKTELDKLMAGVDVGLMILANVPAFYYGTSPNKFFDYISMGLPVLNNYPGWLAAMIEEERIGVAVAPESPASFAEGLIFLAENPSERVQMARRARAFAAREFDREQLTERFVDELESAAVGI